MANYGIKSSPPGQDVKTVSDKNARFTSKYRSLKVLKWGNFSFTVPATGDYTYTIAHGLNYAPAFDVFSKVTAQFTFLDSNSYPNAWFNIGGSNRFCREDASGGVFAYTDATNLNIATSQVFKSEVVTGRYYIYVDPCQEFTSTNNYNLTHDYGMKVSKSGQDVKETDKEYNMGFSTKYNSIQYYEESIKSKNLTLPEMWASPRNDEVEEATYVDFYHGLGYPPYFQAYFETSTISKEIPFNQNDIYYDPGSLYTDYNVYEVSAWCDSTRIRVTFWRRSAWLYPDQEPNKIWGSETITVKVIPFAENLEGLNG